MKKIIGIICGIIILIAGITSALATNNCYWETENPNIELGYTETKGYQNNQITKQNITQKEGWKYYPIRDMVNAKKVLLHNKLISWTANGQLSAWTIKVIPAERTGNQYKEDIETFKKIGCDLPEKKSYGYNTKELSDTEKWIIWFKENYECHTECHTWNFCAFGSCSENRICLPKCTKIT